MTSDGDRRRKGLARMLRRASTHAVLATMFVSFAGSHAASSEIRSHFVDYGDQLHLIYASVDCFSECPVAFVICRADAPPEFWLAALSGADMAVWLFGPAYREGSQPGVVLLLDDTEVPLRASELSYGGGGDMFQNWWVKLQSSEDWLTAFGAAGATIVRNDVFEIELPSTPEDRAKRAAFVEACLAM